MSKNIEELRKDIEKIDESLVDLLRSRFKLVKQIGEIKKQTEIPEFDKKRERSVLAHILSIPHYPLDTHELKRLYQLILSISRNTQVKMME